MDTIDTLNDFESIEKTLEPRLKRMVYGFNGRSRYEDQEDYLQEILCHLWQFWAEGNARDKNKSYLLKNAWFYMQNHLRQNYEPEMRSLDEPVRNDTEDDMPAALSDLLAEPALSQEAHDAKNTVFGMLNNGLTPREKEVVRYFLNGYTVREIGENLGVSHVMVIKIKSKICRKWKHKIN